MNKKVMEWCEYELLTTIKHKAGVHEACSRCYGVVQYIINAEHGWASPEGRELAEWWSNEMLPRFRKAEFD